MMESLDLVGPIGHEPAELGSVTIGEKRRQPTRLGQVDDQLQVREVFRLGVDDERFSPRLLHRCDDAAILCLLKRCVERWADERNTYPLGDLSQYRYFG